MRYIFMNFVACLCMLSMTMITSAEEDAPRRLQRPIDVLSLDGAKLQAIPASAIEDASATEAKVETTGDQSPEPRKREFARDFVSSEESTSVSERLREMRRNSVDVDLSQSFVAGPETQTVQHQGLLPEVAKRPAGKIVPQPTAAQSADQMPANPASQPTPAGPRPASTNRSNLHTQPIDASVHPNAADATPTDARSSQPLTVQTFENSPRAESANSKRPQNRGRTVLLTNRAPAITFETSGPRKITIGQESTYKVRIINMGDVDARKLVVSVRLPIWADVQNHSATIGNALVDTPDETTSAVNWQLESLAANGSETLTLGIVPRQSRPIELGVGWTFNPDQAVAQIEVQEPMLQMDVRGPAEVRYGETATYAITLSNPGTGPARNVVLNLMPTTQQRVAGSREMGTLEIGERKTVEIELTAHQAGRLQVRAMAQADGGLRDEAAQDVIVRRANLEMAVLGPPRNYAASLATYKIRIENTGDAVAEHLDSIATLPAGAKFVSGSDGARYIKERGQIEWQMGSLQPNASRVLQFQCVLNSAGENRVDMMCQADTDLNVTKSVMTHVEALADLQLSVLDPRGATEVGDDAVYEVRIQNRGTKAAEVVSVVGYFSEGIEPVSIRGAKGEMSTGQVMMEPIQSIGPGQEVVFQITARADRPGNHVFRAELQCGTPETRLAAEEWTKYFVSNDDEGIRQAKRPAEVSRTTDPVLRLEPSK